MTENKVTKYKIIYYFTYSMFFLCGARSLLFFEWKEPFIYVPPTAELALL